MQQSGYYRWVIVFAAFAFNVLCFGGFALVSVLIKPLASEFGWLRGEIAAAYTLAVFSTALAGVAFGRISDRYGVRITSAFGAFTMVTCLLLAPRVSTLWQLYALFAVFGALGHGALFTPLTAAVSNWFAINRGLAVGLAMAGTSIGVGTVPLIASAIIADSGWRDALATLGIGYLVVAVPLVLIVRNPPKPATAEAGTIGGKAEEVMTAIAPREAIAWICTAIVFTCIGLSIPLTHVPSLASDLGLSIERAASVLTVIAVVSAISRPVLGYVADRIGPLNTYVLVTLAQIASVFWFTQVPSLAGLYVVAAVYGIFSGGLSMSALVTVRSLVPARIAGTAIGLVSMFGLFGMGLGGYLGGLTFDRSGNYVLAFALAAAAGMITLAVLLLLRVRLRRAARLPVDLCRVQTA